MSEGDFCARPARSKERTNLIHDDLGKVTSQVASLYEAGHINGEEGDPSIEFICFSGGGISGAAFIGVMKELNRRNLKVKYWVGSSAGSIAALFAALGTPPEFLENLILETDTRIFLDYGGKTSNSKSWWSRFQEYGYGITELISKWGAVRGNKFKEWLHEQMKVLGWDPHLTFAQLYDQTGQHLVITTTSLNTFETLDLSRSSYPHMEIADAVDVSIRIPFLFQPITMADPVLPEGKRILVDGGILDNLPINACDLTSQSGEVLAYNRKAIGFTLMHNGKWTPDYTEISSLMKYSLTFIQAMHKRIQIMQSHQPYFWERIVPIETTGVTATDFGIEREKLIKVIESGELAAKKFLDQREAMIKNCGPLPRNLFIPGPRLRYSGMKYLSDDLIEHCRIYQTNPAKFSLNVTNL